MGFIQRIGRSRARSNMVALVVLAALGVVGLLAVAVWEGQLVLIVLIGVHLGAVATLLAAVRLAEGRLSRLTRSQSASLRSEVESFRSQVDSLSSRVDSLGSQVDSLPPQIDSLVSQIDTEIERLIRYQDASRARLERVIVHEFEDGNATESRS